MENVFDVVSLRESNHNVGHHDNLIQCETINDATTN